MFTIGKPTKRPTAHGRAHRQFNGESSGSRFLVQQASQQCQPIPAELTLPELQPLHGAHKELAEIPAFLTPSKQLHPLGRMHEGQRQNCARGFLQRKVGVIEGYRLAGTDRPVEDGKIRCRRLRQIPVPIDGGTHVQQLVDSTEKGGFRIGFRQSGKRCFCSFCGHRITAMACQGETPEGRVTQFEV